MAELVADCPRCGSKKITFNLLNAIKVDFRYSWQYWYETFCICRQCARATIFILSENVRGDYEFVHKQGLENIKFAVNDYVTIEGYVGIKDTVNVAPPKYIPDNIEAIFREGAACYSIGCNNAAGAMFRLCIDLATKVILPQEGDGLNSNVRGKLFHRLEWLFNNGNLPEGLRELSTCVREDGNDGAHDGTLSKEDAGDLLDFTNILMERIFTEPERLRLAQERRFKRRQKS